MNLSRRAFLGWVPAVVGSVSLARRNPEPVVWGGEYVPPPPPQEVQLTELVDRAREDGLVLEWRLFRNMTPEMDFKEWVARDAGGRIHYASGYFVGAER